MSDKPASSEPVVLAVRSNKGGVGKSTVAQLLALGAKRALRRPIVVDLDIGGSELIELTKPKVIPSECANVFDMLTEPSWRSDTPGLQHDLEEEHVVKISLTEGSDESWVLPSFSPWLARDLRRDHKTALLDLTACNTPFLRHKLRQIVDVCSGQWDVVILDLEPFAHGWAAAAIEALEEEALAGCAKRPRASRRHLELWVFTGDPRDCAETLRAPLLRAPPKEKCARASLRAQPALPAKRATQSSRYH